jgi:hypothetical protein
MVSAFHFSVQWRRRRGGFGFLRRRISPANSGNNYEYLEQLILRVGWITHT